MEQKTQAGGELPLSTEQIRTLLTRIEKGNSAALISFYDATSRLIFGVILRILRDRTSAEETVLDVYTRVWNRSAIYDPAIDPVEWLLGMAHRSAMSRSHFAKRDTRQETGRGMADPKVTVAPDQQKMARASISAITDAQRELLELAYYGGLSCGEIAAQIGKPVGAVRTHIRAGLSKFGESLQKPVARMAADARDGGER